MTLAKKMVGGLMAGLALSGCVGAEAVGSAPPPAERAGEALQELLAWQCSCDLATQYIQSVSLAQGSALGCGNGEAYVCQSIPWCTRGSFTQCSPSFECPPGWHASGLRSGPGYCNGVMESVSCSAIPHPSGTYATCDAVCALGFVQINTQPGMPSCDFGTKITCQK